MTDNEIRKALELCATLDSGNCKKCPCREICNENDGTLTKSTLDLINRQQAEIEQWKEGANRYQNLWCIAVDDIETTKSEAIKEFAERLKIKVKMYNSEDVDEGDLIDDLLTVGETVEIIDNLVKEMTEVSE